MKVRGVILDFFLLQGTTKMGKCQRIREGGFLTHTKEFAVHLYNQNPFVFHPSLGCFPPVIFTYDICPKG